jgi:capsule biosynthesis phosphatase
MINDGIEINAERIENFSCVGTPLQLKIYCESNRSTKQKRFCFDLDNTLVTYPKTQGDYSTVDPIHKNIEYLRFLKESGHHIIIYTARRMKTHGGNVGSIIADIGKVTLDTLLKFKIPYDELFFGKPYADFYIDDLGVNCFHQVDKILGLFDTKNEPRDFNSITYQNEGVIKTTTNRGEIYWYNNMPNSVSEMFPKIISASGNTIEMEKIKGINYSYLYINGGLRELDIDLLFKTLKSIHSSEKSNAEENYHDNYGNKLRERYLQNIEMYNKIPDADEIYQIIMDRMEKYKLSGLERIGVIHGDPVFTNVFLTETGIKYIDPRGKIGNSLTVFGDVYYDFAKAYQSILGYDFILNDIDFSFEYQEKIKLRFESNFTGVELRIIKDITASLLFTLMPLHSFSESRFSRYIKLIKTIL